MEAPAPKGLQHRRLFFTLSGSFLILFVIEMLWSHGIIGNQVFFIRHNDTYMDFFNMVVVVPGWDIYSNHQFMYPPLAAMLIREFSLLIPPAMLDGSAKALRMDQSGQMAFLAFLLLGICCVALLIASMFRGSRWERRLLIFLVLFSLPFLYTYERGNAILYAVALLLAYVYWKDSPKWYLREVALLALAAAASLKVYPALFGLLLLRERRWGDMAKALAYGLALFFLPFLLFGGFGKIPDLLETLRMGSAVAAGDLFGYKVDLTNLLRIAGVLLHLDDAAVLRAAPWVSYGLLALTIPAAAGLKQDWKAQMLLACALIICPPFNFVYALVYMAVPLIAFLNKEQSQRSDGFYSVVFAMLLSPLYVGNVFGLTDGRAYGGFPLTIMNLLQGILCAVCFALLLAQGYRGLFQGRRAEPAARLRE